MSHGNIPRPAAFLAYPARMGPDFIVHFECETKRSFGSGDSLEGSQRRLAMIKARSRLEVLKEAAAKTGQTTLELEGDAEAPLNTLLRALFRAWKLNVLLMDA